MTSIFIIFMVIILIIGLVIVLCMNVSDKDREVNDKQFYDEDGDHAYYDRSIIEKKEFARKHPNIKGIRTLRRLFGNNPDDKQ